jgi:hypothetical protein
MPAAVVGAGFTDPGTKRRGRLMLFFGRKKRLIDYASCAG